MDGFAVRVVRRRGATPAIARRAEDRRRRADRAPTRCRGRRGRGGPDRDRRADPGRRRHHRADRERRARWRDGDDLRRSARRASTSAPPARTSGPGRSWCRRASAWGRRRWGSSRTRGSRTRIVHPRPRVIVLSTGDELIPPTETPRVRSGPRLERLHDLRGAPRRRRASRCWPASSATTSTR